MYSTVNLVSGVLVFLLVAGLARKTDMLLSCLVDLGVTNKTCISSLYLYMSCGEGVNKVYELLEYVIIV